MNKHHSILATVSTLACVATLTLSGCGGGGGSRAAAFCKDYSSAGSLASDPATPMGVAFFDKVAREAPSAIKADVKTVATNARNMLNDNASGVDTNAMQAAADRVDNYASDKCPNQ